MTNKLTEETEAWLIDLECDAAEPGTLSDDTGNEYCVEDFMMIYLRQRYLTRLSTVNDSCG